jgi:anthranilate synthase component 2
LHGQASPIRHAGTGLFAGIPSPLTVGRYHSLVVEPNSLPPVLRPAAWTDDGVLMAFEHTRLPVFGVQFHPESILTEHGYDLAENFLRLAGLPVVHGSPELFQNELAEPPKRCPPLPNQPVTF